MINELLAITWNADPVLFSYGKIEIRYYGVLFSVAFLLGNYLMINMYKHAGKVQEDLDILLIYMLVAVVAGARLGHCLFYQPDYYLADPIKILYIWEGGLASHGAAVGILLALFLYSRTRPDQPYLWVLDRIVITVALSGFFIRFGNFMNSEIVGVPTDLPWGVIFAQNGEDFARHPAQLYESIFYLLSFIFLWFTYLKTKENTPNGKIFGWFLILIFGFRFLVEFIKQEQVDFEQGMALNMGQLLSIPFICIGIYVLYKSKQNSTNELSN